MMRLNLWISGKERQTTTKKEFWQSTRKQIKQVTQILSEEIKCLRGNVLCSCHIIPISLVVMEIHFQFPFFFFFLENENNFFSIRSHRTKKLIFKVHSCSWQKYLNSRSLLWSISVSLADGTEWLMEDHFEHAHFHGNWTNYLLMKNIWW